MDVNYIDTEPNYHITKEYGFANENLKIEDLTELFATCYTVKKKGSKEPEEIYAFTTDCDQAFKRFKLLPYTKCFMKRIFTDDDELIRLAIEGTKPKVTADQLEDLTPIDIRERLAMFRDEDEDGNTVLDLSIKTADGPDEIEC